MPNSRHVARKLLLYNCTAVRKAAWQTKQDQVHLLGFLALQPARPVVTCTELPGTPNSKGPTRPTAQEQTTSWVTDAKVMRACACKQTMPLAAPSPQVGGSKQL